VRHRLANVRSYNNTFNGESVKMVARGLLEAARPDERLVLFDFMDGWPCANVSHKNDEHRAYLNEVLEQVRKTGIETVGVGINTEATEEFYPDCVQIQDATKLATTGLGVLERILLGNTQRGTRAA